ncbi:MAG: transporter [Planctomycetes bacterium]|nr:transporter [Planctomycetota bacterium]
MSSHPAHLLACSWALSALASLSLAQDTISTDRPGLTYTPWLVPTGRFQAELGAPNLAVTRGDGADTTAWNAPLQLRYGLCSDLELRLGSPLYTSVRDDQAHTTIEGWGDVELGAKAALLEPRGFLPRAALIFGARLPVGEDEFTAHQAGYSLNLAADWDLGHGRLLRGLAGAVRTPSGGDDGLQGNFAVLYGQTLSARWSSYVELGYLPGFHLADDQALAGAGVAFLLNQDLQLDLSGDFGLNEDSPDALLSLGVSWRY